MLKTLKAKLFFSMVLLGIIPLFLGGVISYSIITRRMTEELKTNLGEMPIRAGRKIESLLYFCWIDIQTTSHLPMFRQLSDNERKNTFFQRKFKVSAPFSWLGVTDALGKIIAAHDPKTIGQDASQFPWFKACKAISFRQWERGDNVVYLRDAFISQRSGNIPVVCFTTPIYGYGGEFLGVLKYEVKMSFLAQNLENLHFGRTGCTMLVRNDGVVLIDKNGAVNTLNEESQRSVTEECLTPGKEIAGDTLNGGVAGLKSFLKARKGESGVMREVGLGGVNSFISFAPLRGFLDYPGFGWSLLSIQSAHEVLAISRTQAKAHMLVGIILIALILTGGYFLLDRGISKPVSALVEATKVIGTGELNYRTSIKSKDEIGKLAHSINQMAEYLKKDQEKQEYLKRQVIHSEKLAAMGRLMARVAHEFGNPLSSILGYAQLLLEGGETEDERKEYLLGIKSQTERIDRVIQDLLNFSRVQSQKLHSFELHPIILKVLNSIVIQRLTKGIQVIKDLEDTHAQVTADEEELEQVFMNIIMNAIDATVGGGELKIRTFHNTDVVSVEISDTGCGIKEEHMDKIFEPFFTTKPEGKGTGLGLSISYGIVEKFGGTIQVKSKEGVGTTFIIILPLAFQSTGNDKNIL